MARIRTIKPQFFLNDEIASLDPLDRILFIGLWTLADRSGRLEDRPTRIKVQILPYDEHDIDSALTRLHEKKFIVRYESQSEKFIEIINFIKHQHCHVKEPESTIPAPGKNGVKPVRKRQEGKGKERKGKEQGIPLEPHSPEDLKIRFNVFWESYPARNGKKLDKGETQDRFEKLSSEDQLQCVVAAQNYAKSKMVQEGFGIKDPKRFIRDGKENEPWRDWIEPETILQGEDMKQRTAQEELLTALKNQNNKKLPPLSEPAVTLFYRIGKRWDELQRRVGKGEDIFTPQKIPDFKTAAAGQ